MELTDLDEVLSEYVDQLESSKAGIQQCLFAYENRCKVLILEIGQKHSYGESDVKFDELLAIQTTLSKLLFGAGVQIGKKLEALVREFDRLDDPDVRRYWFDKFQDGLTWPEYA
ncbi:hypothetical protein ATO10_05457 [Actibacterium atlanticum]|uniref:Uncharacterized protein n=1 Tax=Actibacterium atlanticum TaxID=1461693 RepID=A0A058ZQ92_9RHOB|nr:hypothetical protein [Actibacterium atlanticum]KCV83031.1 hypothetical protein ATO10_05457 [Actibacterium atlanticum]